MPKGMPATYDQKVDQEKYSENWNKLFGSSKKSSEEEEILLKHGKISYDINGNVIESKSSKNPFKDIKEEDLQPKMFKTKDGGYVTRTPIVGDRSTQTNKEYKEEKRG